MRLNIKKDYKFLCLLTIAIILIVLISIYTISIKNKLYISGEIQKDTGVIEKIDSDTEVVQTFVASSDNLSKVVLDFEPYKDETNCGGEVIIGIKDSTDNILAEEKITRNYIRENPKYTISFKKQTDSKDKEYSIYIKFENLEKFEKFYSLKITEQNEFLKNKLYINGQEQANTSIIFQDFYSSPTRIAIYISVISFMIIGIYIISFIIYKKRDLKVENIFLIIMLFVGVLFLITMPTFKNHDEYYHWLRAYEVSQGNFVTPIKDGVQGSEMPDAVSEVFPSDWTTMNYSTVKEKLEVKNNEEEKGILNSETAAVYSFVQYIPQAVGIFIARLFTNNTYLITYAGRIANMIISIILLYLAIKIIPFGKKVLLIPAMIPIAIEGFTSLSPDATTISIAFLYIAYILHLTFKKDKKIEMKQKLLLLVMSIVIALCKIVYIPLVGLMLIIPKEKFKNQSNKNKIFNFCIIAGIAVVINLIWLGFAGRYLENFREGDSKIQVLLALKDPLKYIEMILYTIDLNGSKYLLSLFGSELGWGEFVKLYSIVPYSIMAIYTFCVIVDEDLKNKFKTYQIVYIALVIIAIIALIFTSLYVQWTTIGKEFIAGVQGRYFLPILPLIMLLLGNSIKVKSLYKKENINKFATISILVLQIFTISQILIVHL